MSTTTTAASSWVDRRFKITERGSTLWTEVRGGSVTFLTMAYIIALNPVILGFVPDADGQFLGGGADPNLAAIAAGTALVAGVMSIAMGVFANFPLALATGLGLNAFVAVAIASQMTWADAMGIVVLEGIIILVLVLTGFREAVFRAVPRELRVAISVGIGLFLAMIGLVNAGVVRRVPDEAGTTVPVQLGVNGELAGWPVLVFIFGCFVLFALSLKKVRGAILIAIGMATVSAIVVERFMSVGPMFGAEGAYNPKGWGLTVPAVPDQLVAAPDFGTLGQFSLLGSFERVGIVAALLLVFSLMLADFFDTVGTMNAIGSEAKLIDKNGNIPGAKRILIVDSVAASAGGAAGVSSNTSYIESAAGVGDGARTGLASIVTGVLFLLALPFTPIVNIIPSEAAVPALLLVGILIFSQVTDIKWSDIEVAIPAFLTMLLMPATYSISVGIGAGFIAWVFIKVVVGKVRQVSPLMWVVSLAFVVYFAIEPLRNLLGVG